jgi:hypothetical protein
VIRRYHPSCCLQQGSPHLHLQSVGVYSQIWAPTFLMGLLEVTLLYCRAFYQRGSCWTTFDTEESLFGSIRGPSWVVSSLGHSEDQAERVSFHHLNFLIIILRGSSSYGCFIIPFCSSIFPRYHSVLVIFLVVAHPSRMCI